MQRSQTGGGGSVNRLRSNSNLTSGSLSEDEDVVHAVEPRARTAMLPPVLVSLVVVVKPQQRNFLTAIGGQAKTVHEHPLCWLGFEEECILTSCKNGELLSAKVFLCVASCAVERRTLHPRNHAICDKGGISAWRVDVVVRRNRRPVGG